MEESTEILIERLSEELSIVQHHLAALTHGLELDLNSSSLQQVDSDHPDFHSPSSDQARESKKEISNTTDKHSKKSHRSTSSREIRTVNSQELLKIVDGREDQREQLHKRRLVLMKCHIEQQLKELRQKDFFLTKQRERRKKKEKTLKLQKKPPRFISTGEDDTQYMMKIYKSAMYQAMSLEHNLKKSGQLSKASDIQSFWDYMFDGRESSSMTTTREQKVSNRQQFVQPQQYHHQQHETHSLVDLEEEGEDEDYTAGYTNSWAITAQSPDKTDHSLASDSDQTSSNKFSYNKLPKLKPVQEILGDPIKKVYSIKRQESAKWERELKMEHLQLKKAYHQSKANEMLMQTHFSNMIRNIERALSPSLSSDSASEVQSLQSLQDTTTRPAHSPSPTTTPSTPINSSHPDTSMEANLSTKYEKDSEAVTLATGWPVTVASDDISSILHSTGIKGKQSGKWSTKQDSLPPIPEVQLAPLSMSAVMKTSKVMEVKTKSSMWKNYVLSESS